MAKYRGRTPKVDAKRFIESFMKHNFADEVAADLGVSAAYVGSRAAYLRSRGVKLPTRHTTQLDINDLNAFIEEIESSMATERLNDAG